MDMAASMDGGQATKDSSSKAVSIKYLPNVLVLTSYASALEHRRKKVSGDGKANS